MRRGLLIFLTLNMLFFAVPFPMILYYNIKSETPPDLSETNPWLALGLVVLSILFWILLLVSYYNKWILRTLAVKRNIGRLKKDGIKHEARILNHTDLSIPKIGYSTYELNLSFKNLVGAEIEQKLKVNDKKPCERRFDTGKKVDLLIDKEMKQFPYFILASFEVSIKKQLFVLLHIGWLVILALITGYYIYSYSIENQGMGWRFMAFYHPLIICPVVLLIGNINILGRLITSLLKSNPKKDFLIKYKGLPAMAKLLKANQTGTYINEQPMVKFELEFMDSKNQTHRASITKIVSLLDLDSTRQKEAAIFYLGDDPQQIAFVSDLNELNADI